MIRAFVGIPVPASVCNGVLSIQNKLRLLNCGLSFTKPQAMHVTLKFLGNISESQLPDIEKTLEAIVSEVLPFRVEVRHLDAFPDLRRPRILWTGLFPEAPLLHLWKRSEERFGALGFDFEEEPFSPHLTLARAKALYHPGRLKEFLNNENTQSRSGSFTVDRIRLYKSTLKREGAEYTCLAEAELGRS